jgi:hypothetical protein
MAVLCLGIALRPSDALGQQKTLKELIVGTWKLKSVYDQTEDGVKHNPWGPGVKGIAMYDEMATFAPRHPHAQVTCRCPLSPRLSNPA